MSRKDIEREIKTALKRGWKPPKKPWTVEQSYSPLGGEAKVCRIMCGEQKIVGWTMGGMLVVFEKVVAAHNATLK